MISHRPTETPLPAAPDDDVAALAADPLVEVDPLVLLPLAAALVCDPEAEAADEAEADPLGAALEVELEDEEPPAPESEYDILVHDAPEATV